MPDVTVHRISTRNLRNALDKLRELPPQQRELLNILASRRGGIVSRETIADELYADREDGGPEYANKVIGTLVHGLRKRGFPIVTHCTRGLSYRVDWSEPVRKARRVA